jgi:integral membrane protein
MLAGRTPVNWKDNGVGAKRAKMDLEFLGQLRRMAIMEGISTLVLFGVAMPLKYLAAMPLAVSIVGPIHGIFFLVFSAMSLMAVDRVPISKKLATASVIAAVFPLAPFLVERVFAKLAEPSNGNA